MSWSIELQDKNNKITMDIGNYTCNVNPMYQKALGISLSELQGKPTREVLDLLDNGIKDMKIYKKDYEELNPLNGWGDYNGALEYLERLYDGCKKHYRSYININ